MQKRTSDKSSTRFAPEKINTATHGNILNDSVSAQACVAVFVAITLWWGSELNRAFQALWAL